MWFVFIVPLIIFFVIFLGIAKSIFLSHKSAEKNIQDMVTTISAYADKTSSVEQEIIKEVVCEYCGAKVPDGASKCQACGASVKNKK